jgi:CDP-glucose 4,6-dehydratase
VVVVTSDKCYENLERPEPYLEHEAMGGHDPYSSSKGCAELVTSAYRRSFFHPDQWAQHRVGVASARAGNVIGGGDWAPDRLVPDMMRAWAAGEAVVIRNPEAVRPWQHVLEPLAGYLLLAEKLYADGAEFGEGWNFGPAEGDARPVRYLVTELARIWDSDAKWHFDEAAHVHEAHLLKLDSAKAVARLGWAPRWSLDETLVHTAKWYRGYYRGEDMSTRSLQQIEEYMGAVSVAAAGRRSAKVSSGLDGSK